MHLFNLQKESLFLRNIFKITLKLKLDSEKILQELWKLHKSNKRSYKPGKENIYTFWRLFHEKFKFATGFIHLCYIRAANKQFFSSKLGCKGWDNEHRVKLEFLILMLRLWFKIILCLNLAVMTFIWYKNCQYIDNSSIKEIVHWQFQYPRNCQYTDNFCRAGIVSTLTISWILKLSVYRTRNSQKFRERLETWSLFFTLLDKSLV